MSYRTICFATLLATGGFLGFAGPIAALTSQPAALSSASDGTAIIERVFVRRTVVRRSVGPRMNRTVVRRTTVIGNRGVVRSRTVVRTGFVRPYRAWVRRPYFGTVIAGVTLGTIVAVSAVPAAPAPNVCWYWADSANTRGYWDYC